MPTDPAGRNPNIRYEPDEQPPYLLSLGLGCQYDIIVLVAIVLTPAIVIRAANQSESYLSWAVFAALIISGLTTVLQAARLGRIGSGHVLIMGTSATFISVSITALVEGGPALLASLIVVSSLFQFALSAWLSLLRRIITPVVAGTVIAMISVTIMPVMFDLLTDVPEGTSPAAAPTSAAVTLIVVVALALRASGGWRLWAPVIGVASGCLIALPFGLYDFERVSTAAWVGLPAFAWSGFDMEFGAEFWALLPAFVFVTLVGAIETVGDAVAIQRVSWRAPRAISFRTVQGAVAADGVGNLLSGLAATVPNTTYSSSVPLAELTGVGARSVGVGVGIVFVTLAFLPKATALLLAIPSPVVAAYAFVLLGLLFMQGMKIIVQDDLDYRKATVAGVAFWLGVGFQNQAIFADYLGEAWSALLGNGMTMGGFAAIVLTLFLELTGPRRRRIEMELDVAVLPKIEDFLRQLASRLGWNAESTERLCSAGEETMLTLLQPEEDRPARAGQRLLLVARGDRNAAEVEFVATSGEENLEDRLALLGERAVGTPAENDLSLRLLRHVASSVRHQQYHDTDIITVRVVAVGAR